MINFTSKHVFVKELTHGLLTTSWAVKDLIHESDTVKQTFVRGKDGRYVAHYAVSEADFALLKEQIPTIEDHINRVDK